MFLANRDPHVSRRSLHPPKGYVSPYPPLPPTSATHGARTVPQAAPVATHSRLAMSTSATATTTGNLQPVREYTFPALHPRTHTVFCHPGTMLAATTTVRSLPLGLTPCLHSPCLRHLYTSFIDCPNTLLPTSPSRQSLVSSYTHSPCAPLTPRTHRPRSRH